MDSNALNKPTLRSAKFNKHHYNSSNHDKSGLNNLKSKVFRSAFLRPPVYRSVSSQSFLNKSKIEPTFSLSHVKSVGRIPQYTARELSANQFLNISRTSHFFMHNKTETLPAVHEALKCCMDIVNDNSRKCEWSGRAYVGHRGLHLAVTVFQPGGNRKALILESRKLKGDSEAHHQWLADLQLNLSKWCPRQTSFRPNTLSLPKQKKISISDDLIRRYHNFVTSPISEAQEAGLNFFAEVSEEISNCCELVKNEELIQSLTNLLESHDPDVIRLSATILSNITKEKSAAEKIANRDMIIQRLSNNIGNKYLERETRKRSTQALLNFRCLYHQSSHFLVVLGGKQKVHEIREGAKQCLDPLMNDALNRCLDGL